MKKEENFISKKIDYIQKIKEARDDIEKIKEILMDGSLFYHKADTLYNELNKKIDYVPYISLAKKARCMAGDTPFKNLSFKNKLIVFDMILDAINAYIIKELQDKLVEEKNDQRN